MYLFWVGVLSLVPTLALAATIPVPPGQSVQAALDRAQAGDTVQLEAGTYQGRVRFPRAGLTLQGRGPTTIIDGSVATSGWTSAGSGIWSAALGSPQAMTSQGKAIWMITDANMAKSGMAALRQPADAMAKTAWGPVPFWDGLEALFGNQGGRTYVRFRDGASPASRGVRSAPAGGVMTVAGVDNITIRQLSIVGGQMGVDITGGSKQTVVEHTTIQGGKHRIALHQGGGHGTIIRHNTLRLDGIGQQAFPPGARNATSPGRRVNLHSYMQNKFLTGDTETSDASIVLAGGSSGVQVLDNDIGYGQMGIVLYQRVTDSRIQGNTFHHFNDIGIYMNADHAEVQIADNLFYDSTHHIRLESMSRGHRLWIYANRFHNPLVTDTSRGPGKHIFLPPPGGSSSPAKVWVYHNSFAGGGYAVDMGGTSERAFAYPHLRVEANVFSSVGISSGGTKVIGHLANNLTQQIWPGGSVPDFVLPQALRDRAPGLDLPGLTAAYVGDGKPDHGALQAGRLAPGPPPVTPPQATLPAPRNLRLRSSP